MTDFEVLFQINTKAYACWEAVSGRLSLLLSYEEADGCHDPAARDKG